MIPGRIVVVDINRRILARIYGDIVSFVELLVNHFSMANNEHAVHVTQVTGGNFLVQVIQQRLIDTDSCGCCCLPPICGFRLRRNGNPA
jgi:hypothetical protein